MKKIFITVSILIISLLFIGPAYAYYITGHVYCDVNGNGSIDTSDTPLANVKITATGTGGTATITTGTDGYYEFIFYESVASYLVTIDMATLPGGSSIILPVSNTVVFDGSTHSIELNWLISSQACQAGACWLTAGGVKFDSILGFKAAESGPKFSFGGNTFPGCSPTAGDGGQWNFVDHGRKIHFQGWQVDQVRCGNVDGIPSGSTSPPTPFNYIEFSGWGTIKGIAGNKGPFAPTYYFVARAEDRNEPGNEKALLPGGGALIDRLFLRVYTNTFDPIGSTTYMIGTNVDSSLIGLPVTITGGNIQIHISSCP
jgi:hypothetical protein